MRVSFPHTLESKAERNSTHENRVSDFQREASSSTTLGLSKRCEPEHGSKKEERNTTLVSSKLKPVTQEEANDLRQGGGGEPEPWHGVRDTALMKHEAHVILKRNQGGTE